MCVKPTLILLCFVGSFCQAAQGNPPPNVVFLLADDLGWADIGFHESDTMTPNIDRLAVGGVRLEQHYVWPTCSPTRVALLTGREPSRFGVLSPLADDGRLPPDTVTLPGALRGRGYTTHISGKWHIGSPPKYRPLLFGFDTSYGYFRGQIDPYTHRYKFGNRTWHRNDKLIDEEGHATDLITNEAIRVIRSTHDKPFFMYVAFSVPHYPLSEPDQWTALYDDRIDDPWRKRNAASITHMDAAIGRIVAALDETGERSNTLIVFTSDNGGQRAWNAPADQYEGRYGAHTTLGNNLPLRGWKTNLYEGGIRVPCCVNWPERIPAGGTRDSPTCITDWLPTFCQLAGEPAEKEWQSSGQDLWPLLLGKAHPQPRTLYWKTRSRSGLRHGQWKLIVDNEGRSRELFDLQNDPNETTNLATAQTERVVELIDLLQQQQQADVR